MRVLILQAVKSDGAQVYSSETTNRNRFRYAAPMVILDRSLREIFNQGQEVTFGSRMDIEQNRLVSIWKSLERLTVSWQSSFRICPESARILAICWKPTTFAMSISCAGRKQRKPFQIYFEAVQRDLDKSLKMMTGRSLGSAEPILKL